MKGTRFLVAGAIVAAAAMALVGCSSGTPGAGNAATVGTVSTAGTSAAPGSTIATTASGNITVWLMQDTLTADAQTAVVNGFEQQSGVTVDVQIQQWDDINTKMTTALATDDPPDVVEIGNTDVPLFAANGGLMDITQYKADLEGSNTWLTGLEGPATVDGKLFAAPFYAGTRAVIYNEDMWTAAGITAAPTSYDEFTADLDKVAAANSATDFSPLYMPGTYWYNALSFLYDAGGALATQNGTTWAGQLETAQSQQGLADFKAFQNKYSTEASRTAPMDTPDPGTVFTTGKTSAIMGNGNALKTAQQAAPDMKIGSFPFPSKADPGQNMPNFLGGSDIAISAKSQNPTAALAFLKYITSDDAQINQIGGASGHVPISNELIDKVTPTLPDNMKSFYVGAKLSISTPATPGWATIESDNSVTDFFSSVASGAKTTQQAAADFDQHLNDALNANS
ncbi:MAG: extracellular solute-binding protein [Micrococcales bacterium]|nr:extracellular solute-binding protein [Micrococcales bacterium]